LWRLRDRSSSSDSLALAEGSLARGKAHQKGRYKGLQSPRERKKVDEREGADFLRSSSSPQL
jgi:hypothetical protein